MIDLLTPLKPFATLPWLAMSPLEVIATVMAVWCVWAYARENIWAWPTGLVTVILQLVLFWDIKLYGEACLQGIYIVLQIYGWMVWARGDGRGDELAITRTSARLWLTLTFIAIAGVVPVALALKHLSDSTTPWWDAAPSVLSLIAQWMITRKKLENWYVWILVNLLSIPLFADKGLYLISLLNVLLLIISIFGVRRWAQTLRASAAA